MKCGRRNDRNRLLNSITFSSAFAIGREMLTDVVSVFLQNRPVG